MAIEMTQSAIIHARNELSKRGCGLGIRLAVERKGCTGLAHKVEFVDEKGIFDSQFDCGGVSLFVDRDSLNFVDGTIIDYVYNDMGGGEFEFLNPNAKNRCGCGESFMVS